MVRMTRIAWTIVVVGLGSWGADAARGEGIQALVGKEGRVQLSRGKERIGEFGAGLFNQQWQSADATADARTPDTADKRHLRIAVPGGGTVAGWADCHC